MRISTLLLFFALVSGVNAFAGDSLNYTGSDGKRQGYWIIYGRMQKNTAYAADSKVEEGRYKDSQKTGIWIAYFPSGIKKTEFTFVNNRPNGPATIYYENGKKSEEGTWVGTRWVGAYKMYYEDGTPRQEFNYSTAGQRDGKQVYKHPNGKVSIDVTMKAGKEEGWKREYDENGNLVRETFFNGGVIDPSKTIEHKKVEVKKSEDDPTAAGNKTETSTVVSANEKPPGTTFTGEGYFVLYSNGQVTQKGTFHLKKLVNGEKRIYNENGMLVQIKLYKDGKYVGDGPIPADANK